MFMPWHNPAADAQPVEPVEGEELRWCPICYRQTMKRDLQGDTEMAMSGHTTAIFEKWHCWSDKCPDTNFYRPKQSQLNTGVKSES